MNTLAENLQALKDSKESIAQAITDKGGTVAETDGFSSFANLISALSSGGKKTQYIEESFLTEYSKQYLTYELDFEPQAVLIKCNEVYSVTQPILVSDTSIKATNRYSYWGCYYFTVQIAEDMSNLLILRLFYPTTGEALIQKGMNFFQTPTKNGDKWQITLGAKDTSSNAYRFVHSGNTSLPLQILFIGE